MPHKMSSLQYHWLKHRRLKDTTWCWIFVLFIFCLSPVNAQNRDPIVCLQTSKGPIYIRVYASVVKNSSASFLDLVNRGFYNGLSFHRVEDWVVQGGDPNGNGTGVYVDPANRRPRYLPLETTPYLRHNAPGVVAMARSSNPNSNSCQFYITKRPKPDLDGSYTIFGGVVQGMNVVYSLSRGDQILSAQVINNSNSSNNITSPSPSPAASGDSGF